MKSVSKRDVAFQLSVRLNIPLTKALIAVDTVLSIMSDSLSSGERVTYKGFGTFEPVLRGPKVGRNPMKPKEAVYHIPARTEVRFRTSPVLIEVLNP